jgi:glycosyltransferase involved in cell wall biosynthesis
MNKPLASIMIPTFNRRRYLPYAIASAIRQTHENIEIFVINDGGEDVADIVNFFADDRIIFINRKENRGKAHSLNEALAQAKGKYITYLDDDDIYYPNHVETLLNALEQNPQYGAAYSDLYKAHCRVESDGRRTVLSKIVEVSRDFDRFFLLHFNHVLHVSLMHKRDLIGKTGFYNECLQILIDWDMTRRLAFFTDFLHVPQITGEYYGPVGECDRISVQMRKDTSKYLKNVLGIRTSRPPKPWPKIQELSIILVPQNFDELSSESLSSVWLMTFYVFTLVLPTTHEGCSSSNIRMPNVKYAPVNPNAGFTQIIDAALKYCDGEFVAIAPSNFKIKQSWVEDPLYALINSVTPNEGFELDGSTDDSWAAIFRKDELLRARTAFKEMPLRNSLDAAGIKIRKPRLEELPFKFDDLLAQARMIEQEGDYRKAAQLYECIATDCQNTLWMKTAAAQALYNAGAYTKSAELLSAINQERPTADTLLLESKIQQKREDIQSAIILLEKAKEILEGSELVWK